MGDQTNTILASEARNVSIEAAAALRTVAPHHLYVHAISTRIAATSGDGDGYSSDDASFNSVASEPALTTASGASPTSASALSSAKGLLVSPVASFARRLSGNSVASSQSLNEGGTTISPARSISTSDGSSMHEIVKSKSESAFGDASSFARNDSNLSLFREAGGSSATTATARDGETFLDSGPITDIKVLFSGERTPPEYRKVCHVGSDKNADVNRRGPGKGVYVCFRHGAPCFP